MVRTQSINLFVVVALLVLIGIVGTSQTNLSGMVVYDGQGQTPVTAPSIPAAENVAGTPLENAIEFLRSFGFFNVVLPFLLVFTVVFAVLEKTRIFGSEKYKGEDVPRRNLNSVVSFCIAFLVVATSNIVKIIQVSLPVVALVLIILIVFLLLFGSLMGEAELKGGINLWKGHFKTTFVIVITLAVLAILLAGFGILGDLLDYIGANITGTFITSILLFVVVIGAVWFVTGKKESSSGEGGKP